LTGKINEKHTSQIWFKEGNIIEFTFNFGCGIFIGENIASNPMNIFKNMINKEDEGNEEDTKKEPEWTMFRSFFLALHGSTELDF
jgi:uncharacterized protein YutD